MKTLLLVLGMALASIASAQSVVGGGLPNVSKSSGTLPVANGGTGSTTVAGALSSLSAIPIGTVAPAALDNGTWLSMNGQVVSQSTYASLFKIIGHQPEFTWTFAKPFSIASTPSGVAFGNSTYVVVLVNGNAWTSPDLVTWTSRTTGVSGLSSVCWDSTNSLFVAVGATNVIITSPDGITWTSRTSGVTSTLQRVFSSGGRTVAVGTAGWITYSTNDTSWTATQPNSGPSLNWLLKLNGTWFTCNTSSISTGIVYSTDGTTWNYVAKPSTNSSVFGGADATYFYLIDASTAEVWRSTNGASWASVTQSANWTYNLGTPVFFSSGVIAWANGNNNSSPSYTSDGYTTVKRLGMSSTTSSAAILGIVLSNPFGGLTTQGFAIATTTSGQSSGGFPCYSADGKVWHSDRSPAFTLSTTQTPAITFSNGYYFMYNSGGNTQIITAPEPYSPATQFQIPTRSDTTGVALLIKAL